AYNSEMKPENSPGPPGAVSGFISELYAPRDAADVKAGERCFYTPENARRIDWTRRLIGELAPEAARPFFIAPLLSQASVHANTAGIFKGFYKNSRTGVGQFGGNGRNALSRICGKIVLPFPVFSASSCPTRVFRQEAAALAASEELYGAVPGGTLDLAYIDPPYNQHPYGSNYFMLNLIASYERPSAAEISRVAGIPKGWNRSAYNKRRSAAAEFRRLVSALRARFLLVSFNSEGFIRRDEMEEILGAFGTVTVFEAPYNTFRGSRNLRERNIHLREYLFALEKERL
nr:DNA adenine methylase [Treponemataceae bacterium]